jgi:hypothetical protein
MSSANNPRDENAASRIQAAGRLFYEVGGEAIAFVGNAAFEEVPRPEPAELAA